MGGRQFPIEAVQRSIRQLLEETGSKPKPLSTALGLGPTAIRDILLPKAKSVSTPTLKAIADHFGVTVEDILSGEPHLPPDGQPNPARTMVVSGRTPSRFDDDDVWVDSVDLAYGMGGAFLDVDAEVERVKLSRSWLRNFTDSPPEKLGIAQGIGDSMEPLLYDRDLVIIDRSARLNDHMSDKTWVFAFGQVGMIKRLRPLPDGSIKIMSVNRSYPDEIAAAGELHIIGRVVASIRRH